ELTRYNSLLHSSFIHELNKVHFQFATHAANTSLDNNLFIIEGWVPDTKRDELTALLASLDIYAEEVAIENKDSIPTYLENKGAAKVGEDVIHIFDVPSITDKDPSVWVLTAFSL